MESKLGQNIYSERRARFVAQLGEGVAIFPGGHLVRRVNDVDHVFRQRSDLLYLTGFDHPNAVAVISQRGLVLFVEPRDRDAETWHGRRPGVDGAIEQFGADTAYPVSELRRRLPDLLQNLPRLFHRFGEDVELDRAIVETLAELRSKGRTGITAPNEISDPHVILDEMRLRKDAHELTLMRHAAEISHDAHRAAARAASPGGYEFELEAELAYVFRKRGGAGAAYPSIVAAGENATILHYTENTGLLREGELVLIDAGVEFGGYASDVTRTYPIGGRFQQPHADVYQAVLAAQRATLEAVRPGTSLRELHDVAVRSLSQSLIDLGALTCSLDQAIADELYKRFYMHGTGHFLGLDVHDVGSHRVEGKPRPLEPGMVFTVEPGLYFRPDEPDCPAELRGIGVRIEDDVVIVDDGYEVLTRSIPKEPSAVETWMQSDT